MTTPTETPDVQDLDSPRSSGGWRDLLRGSAGIAVAMAVTNIGTYGFQMVAARVLGPADYGAIASMMALLMVVAVVQLGLQATAARRVSAEPEHVEQIEDVVWRVTVRASLALGLLMLVLSPLVWKLLVLDSIVPALLMAVAAVPLTLMGGQAGILQGERRWGPLAAVYLAVGVPRLVFGTAAIYVRPSETSAMVGVLLGLLVPVAIGWWVLRQGRAHAPAVDLSPEHRARPIVRETLAASMALLAFLSLSNVDIVVARHVLDSHDAGLYAGGLILTKAVLFLPQFVVVVAFPAMSTVAERRRALLRSVALVGAIGVVCTLGAWILSRLALVFVGGAEYVDVQGRLWLFAILGTLLAIAQLVVYSVLARQGTRSGYLVWVGAAVLVAAGLAASSLTGLALTVIAVDAVLVGAILALSLARIRADEADALEPTPPAAPPATDTTDTAGTTGSPA
ncbi:lipopolysaccharide biosynthesis protein [Nocardioides sp. TRM66260-LWL]|uniref:lipopolysaccharide biosynthesis protein n=1 Tax=Nocardioides sp. TRM66260-LWL TaxID=2874478 RepID=UPI001CC4ADB6|nr:lipopolysaccharide biosynthesis protein [Nocardioides sp. TRM66260-LWL]MBZ5733690.1 lipopolysaccharide biosynthesis protein [Nocardioides sp. TRM66260-LWL]